MISLVSSILIVFGYILFGYILKKIRVVSNKIEVLFSSLSFKVLLPIALLANFWTITFPDFMIIKLLISFFGSGIIIFLLSFYISKFFYKFKTDDSAIFGLASCFGNSVALGIPLMYSVLGPIKVMPYMILVIFHGIIHFTYTIIIIENYRNRFQSNAKKILKTLIELIKNIVLVSMLVGLALNFYQVPFPQLLQNIIHPIANIALPTILVSMGMALGGFKLISNFSYSFILTTMKNFIHPLIAFLLAKYVLLLSPLLIFIVTMAAALPSGTQTYYFSFRYNSLQNIIAGNIVFSTFISFFTLSILMLLFGY